MIKSIRLAIITALLTTTVSGEARQPVDQTTQPRPDPTDAATAKPVRVLFIGNSLTFWHTMPQIIEDLAAKDGTDFAVEWTLVKSSATSVHRFWAERKGDSAAWKGREAKKLIQAGGWDYVVLQPYDSLTKEEIVAVRHFHKLIQASGARLVLYMTAGRVHEGPLYENAKDKRGFIDQERSGFAELAKELDALVVPAMEAVWNAKHADPALDLRTPVRPFDNVHPSPIEAYLVACTFYTVLSGHSPVGNPMHHVEADPKFHPVDTDLDKATATWLQAQAVKAVRAFHKDHGIGKGYHPPELKMDDAQLNKPARPELSPADRNQQRAALRLALAQGYLDDLRRRADKHARVERKYVAPIIKLADEIDRDFPKTPAAQKTAALREAVHELIEAPKATQKDSSP